MVPGGPWTRGGIKAPTANHRKPAPQKLRQWGAVSAASEPACRRAHAALFSGSLAADGWALAGKCPACAVASCLARGRAATHCHSLWGCGLRGFSESSGAWGGVEVPAGKYRKPAPPRLRQWGAVSAASEPACRRAHAALFSGSLAADGWALAGKCPACAVASCLARGRAATHCHSLWGCGLRGFSESSWAWGGVEVPAGKYR